MKYIQALLTLAFLLATTFGLVWIPWIAWHVTAWVLFPFAVAFCGFVTYFLNKGLEGV
jgi:hypothetical protein